MAASLCSQLRTAFCRPVHTHACATILRTSKLFSTFSSVTHVRKVIPQCMTVKTQLCWPSRLLLPANKQPHFSTAVVGSMQLFHRRLDTIKREATLSQPARFIHPNQTVVRYDMQTGRKQTCKDVPARFYRFANGLWLRAIAGRDRKMWKKHRKRRRRNKQFVFCNHTQSLMLDRMVTMEYKTRRYYPDDPLQQFQERNFCGLKQYPGRNFLLRHQKKFREPSASDPVDGQIHQSFGVNKYYKPKKKP